MASADDDQEFDFASFIQSPMAMIMSAMGAADTAKKSFSGLIEAVNSLQRSAAAFESILERVDTVVAQIEAPAKVLGPEMQRLASRMSIFGDMFDRLPIDQLPDTVELLVNQLTSVMSGLADLPKKLGPFGDLFGGASALMGLGRPTSRSTQRVEVIPPPPPSRAVVKKPAAKKPAAKKPVAKKPAAKKPAARK